MDLQAVDALLAGADSWGEYRSSLPKGTRPDFADVKLPFLDVSGIDLSDAIFTNADLRSCRFYSVNLRGADFRGADLFRANLNYVDLSHAELARAHFWKSSLASVNFNDSNLVEAQFYDAKLDGADFTRANLGQTHFSNATVVGGVLKDANLTQAVLHNMWLVESDLSGANLTQSSLTGAKLEGSNLSKAKLTSTDLSGSTLTNANLTQANLTDARLVEATLTSANLSGANLTRADLTNAHIPQIIVDDSTITPYGYNLLENANDYLDEKFFTPGTTRIRINLPSDIDPRIFADLMNAIAAMSNLLSVVGSRLQEERPLGSDSRSHGATLSATSSDSPEYVIKRVQYGSEFIVHLQELWPAIVSAGSAVGTTAAWMARKRVVAVSKFLWKLADPITRKALVESHRAESDVELQRLAAESEKYKASQRASELERKKAEREIAKIELEVKKLELVATTQEEVMGRIDEIEDDVLRERTREALPQIMPLLVHDLTLESVAERDVSRPHS